MKTERPAIPVLSDNPSKAEQIAFVEAIVEHVGVGTMTNNYLTGLFNNDFARWTETQIRNDFPANLYAELLAANKEVNQERAAHKAECERREDLEAQIIKERAEGSHIIEKILADKDVALKNAYTLNTQLCEARNDLTHHIAKHEQEINRLKVTIADMYLKLQEAQK